MSESTQHKLDRVRKPRVHVTYDVEVGDAMEQKELPFVLGVIGDFTGKTSADTPKLGSRKFVEITPENFDTALAGMKPRVQFSVENRLNEDVSTDVAESVNPDPNAPQMKVDLTFTSLADFNPENVARNVAPLAKLLDLREKLSDLRASLQGKDGLDDLLQQAIQDTEMAKRLGAELGKAEGAGNE